MRTSFSRNWSVGGRGAEEITFFLSLSTFRKHSRYISKIYMYIYMYIRKYVIKCITNSTKPRSCYWRKTASRLYTDDVFEFFSFLSLRHTLLIQSVWKYVLKCICIFIMLGVRIQHEVSVHTKVYMVAEDIRS